MVTRWAGLGEALEGNSLVKPQPQALNPKL